MSEAAVKAKVKPENTKIPSALYINQEALAKLLCVNVRTIERWRISGDGPPFIRCGKRHTIYAIKAVEDWAAANTFTSHADEFRRAG